MSRKRKKGIKCKTVHLVFVQPWPCEDAHVHLMRRFHPLEVLGDAGDLLGVVCRVLDARVTSCRVISNNRLTARWTAVLCLRVGIVLRIARCLAVRHANLSRSVRGRSRTVRRRCVGRSALDRAPIVRRVRAHSTENLALGGVAHQRLVCGPGWGRTIGIARLGVGRVGEGSSTASGQGSGRLAASRATAQCR